jgi:hypothetical protein
MSDIYYGVIQQPEGNVWLTDMNESGKAHNVLNADQAGTITYARGHTTCTTVTPLCVLRQLCFSVSCICSCESTKDITDGDEQLQSGFRTGLRKHRSLAQRCDDIELVQQQR